MPRSGTANNLPHEPEGHDFPKINRAYNATFQPDQLSLGLVLPLESNRHNPVPTMADHIERAQRADALGFSALWLRDVPFNVPTFGDAGHIFDPFVYLGALAIATKDISLGVASIVLPLRHPAHVAKAAASADALSGGRLLLGIASGDRPEEYPAMGMTFPDRGERFRDSVAYLRSMDESYPTADHNHGSLSGQIDMLPKPTGGRVPLLITGGSQQSPEWIAQNGDGWMTYPRDAASQGRIISAYRNNIAKQGGQDKPVMQSLYVDILPDPKAQPRPIHMGFQSGTEYLRSYLREIKSLGVNLVALNLRFNQADIETTLSRIADDLLPEFSTKGTENV